jgi:DtxR family Mn-dependent transcriptional regulator
MVHHIIWKIIVMTNHNFGDISESEQMYLITTARLIEDGQPEPIPLSDIAKEMSVLPVSVNQMVRKLEGEGLLKYLPYKGVELTSQGKEVTLRILRNRRLWEVFLVDQLKVSLEEADSMACAMEHVTPDDIAQRLAKFLGDPATGPGGQPIPDIDAAQVLHNWVPLTHLEVGMQAHIAQIDGQQAVVRFLTEEGFRPGSVVTLRAIGALGSRLVEVEKGYVELSADIASSILLSHPTLAYQASHLRNTKQG